MQNLDELEVHLLSAADLLQAQVIPNTVSKLTLKDFHDNLHTQLGQFFPRLRDLCLVFGSEPGTFGPEAPNEKSFYDQLFAHIPSSLEKIRVRLGHLQANKSKYVH